MPFKNKRNSRDDKSEKPSRTTSASTKSNSFRPERAEGTNNKKRVFSGDSRKPLKSGLGKTNGKSDSKFSSERRNPGSFSSSSEERQGKRSFREKSQSEIPAGGRRKFSEGAKKNFGDIPQSDRKKFSGSKEAEKKSFFGQDNKFSDKNAPKRFNNKPFKPRGGSGTERQKFRPEDKKWSSEERVVNKRPKKSIVKDDGLIRLNRFIANAGICSRRKADELIAAGVVSVNGEPVTELGFKVDPAKDSIRYNGETLKREKMVYVLLNKPKDYITTTDDPQERKTVMSLVEKASRERIYPVGRLDRNTTGLLLMTNDGDLAEKLSHPRNNITKLYQVELNKSLSQGDMNKIAFGIELEDGIIKPDQVSYVAGGSKKEVGIQIHSGKNRVVRRIFESLGYEVVKLDRVVYSNLTKKDLPRGRWRYLEEKEIIQLKHLIK